MLAVTPPNGDPILLPEAKGYRINKKTGLLTIWGRHYTTIAAYPKGAWQYISEPAPSENA
jgi:hypothetical protein